MTTRPLVSIVTPVYNNEEYLSECIESVLAQTYRNWDYTIVNNSSADGSGELARRYAAKDRRIRVVENRQFLRVVANHNHALRQISPQSKYCKMVFADDFIFPRCIEEMVAVAEEHPSVGVVGAYGLGNEPGGGRKGVVVWTGLPYPSTFVSGRDVCRQMFLQDIPPFGTTPHAVLYRSDLVRSHDPFYNESNLHADKEVCVVLLKTCDFAFVHQVLMFTRLRPASLSAMAIDTQAELGCHLYTLVMHGPHFLSADEMDSCKTRHLAKYYNFLAVSAMRFRRKKEFWEFHKRKLDETVGFSRTRLAGAVIARLCEAVLNPYNTIEKMRIRRPSILTESEAQNVELTEPQAAPSGSAGRSHAV